MLDNLLRKRRPRFLLVATLPVVLVCVTFGMLGVDLVEHLRTARLELQGVGYARNIQEINLLLAQVRGLTQMQAAGDMGVVPRIEADRAQLETRFAELLANPASEVFGFSAEAGHIVQAIREELARAPSPDAFTRLTAWIDRLREFLLKTAEKSHLLLDPEVESYYLVTLIVDRVPALVESVGQLRGIAAGFHTSTMIDDERMLVMERRIEGIRGDLADVGRIARAIHDHNPRDAGRIMQRFEESRARIEQFMQESLTVVNGRPSDALAYFELGSETIGVCRNLCQESRTLLAELLERRIERLQARLAIGVLAGGAAVALMLVLFISFNRREGQFILRLQDMAAVDPLTGAGNRRAFDEALARKIEAADRYGRPFSLVAFDIDHFKEVNDTHGHGAGDEVIRGIVGIAMSIVRHPVDALYRSGGDEFHLLLPETGLAGALELAERLRTAVAATRCGAAGHVGISLGVAQHPQGESARALLKRADDALYAAKRDGRNRVVPAREETP